MNDTLRCDRFTFEFIQMEFELLIQEIQVGAARLLSMLFFIADYSQSYTSANACFGLGDKQVPILYKLILKISFLKHIY